MYIWLKYLFWRLGFSLAVRHILLDLYLNLETFLPNYSFYVEARDKVVRRMYMSVGHLLEKIATELCAHLIVRGNQGAIETRSVIHSTKHF